MQASNQHHFISTKWETIDNHFISTRWQTTDNHFISTLWETILMNTSSLPDERLLITTSSLPDERLQINTSSLPDERLLITTSSLPDERLHWSPLNICEMKVSSYFQPHFWLRFYLNCFLQHVSYRCQELWIWIWIYRAWKSIFKTVSACSRSYVEWSPICWHVEWLYGSVNRWLLPWAYFCNFSGAMLQGIAWANLKTVTLVGIFVNLMNKKARNVLYNLSILCRTFLSLHTNHRQILKKWKCYWLHLWEK